MDGVVTRTVSGGPAPIGLRPAGLMLLAGMLLTTPAAADPVTLAQPATDQRAFQARVDVQTTGHVYTSRTGGKSERHTMNAAAQFEFIERRLPPGGRDAQALRAVRDFQSARMETVVSDRRTSTELAPRERLIVANGEREGVSVYSPTTLLSRDTLDLLEMPADPLVLTALLPTGEVETGAEWTPAEWVTQMFATVEAVEAIQAKCRLDSLEGNKAVISVACRVRGQRLGANTDVDISGTITFDTGAKAISAAALTYGVKSTIGTVTPGLDARTEVRLTRRASATPGRLAEQVLDAIPVTAPTAAQRLVFEAEPWRIRLSHGRGWHVFQAVLEGSPQVVILRQIDRGSLVCQCNVAKLPSAAAGQHAPKEQFDHDIERSLGSRFKQFLSRDTIPSENGRMIYRVEVEGESEVTGSKGSVQIPMNWIYYLVADPSGRQMSFVFAVEPSLRGQLAEEDIEMVQGVQFQ